MTHDDIVAERIFQESIGSHVSVKRKNAAGKEAIKDLLNGGEKTRYKTEASLSEDSRRAR